MKLSFNGSTVREPWLCPHARGRQINHKSASMGPRSENRGYVVRHCLLSPVAKASMGPRSENRGYVTPATVVAAGSPGCFNGSTVREPWLWSGKRRKALSMELQWVHGPRTVVMQGQPDAGEGRRAARLQWVHGPRTVVMAGSWTCLAWRDTCFNGSTVREPWLCTRPIGDAPGHGGLQWVHGPRTVVMFASAAPTGRPNCPLQWVHGPRTVVMMEKAKCDADYTKALQWVHGPRTVVMTAIISSVASEGRTLQWVHGPRTVVMHLPGLQRLKIR